MLFYHQLINFCAACLVLIEILMIRAMRELNRGLIVPFCQKFVENQTQQCLQRDIYLDLTSFHFLLKIERSEKRRDRWTPKLYSKFQHLQQHLIELKFRFDKKNKNKIPKLIFFNFVCLFLSRIFSATSSSKHTLFKMHLKIKKNNIMLKSPIFC